MKNGKSDGERLHGVERRMDRLGDSFSRLPAEMSRALSAAFARTFQLPADRMVCLDKRLSRIERRLGGLEKNSTTLNRKISAIYLAVHRGGGNGKAS